MADAVQALLPDQLRHAMMVAREKGASSTLTTIPVAEHEFFFDVKSDFHDHVHLRYCWPIDNLPSVCAFGARFTVHRVQICKLVGFIHMRHDDTTDFLAKCMREVHNDVEVEPPLLPLFGEMFRYRSTNTQPDARADIRVQVFWTVCQNAFFDTRVFYPPRRRAISPGAYHLSFARLRVRRSVSTGNGSPRWSMAASHQWCFLPLEDWVRKRLWLLRSWRAP